MIHNQYCSQKCYSTAYTIRRYHSDPEFKHRHQQSEKRYRLKHPQRNREQKRKRTEYINRLKTRPCQDCGIQYNPWVMDFDHRLNTDKKFTISSERMKPLTQLNIEISKCDVVCSNCHRERTHRRLLEKQTMQNV